MLKCDGKKRKETRDSIQNFTQRRARVVIHMRGEETKRDGRKGKIEREREKKGEDRKRERKERMVNEGSGVSENQSKPVA